MSVNGYLYDSEFSSRYFSIGKYPSDIHKLSQIEQFGRVVAVATELEQPC